MRALTIWRFEADAARVWNALADTPAWPCWWPGLAALEELSLGDNLGVGAVRRFTWRGLLPYKVRFLMRTTAMVPGELAAGEASGDLAGTGVWRFAQEGPQAVVRYEWRVSLTPWWLRGLGVVTGPLLAWNHDLVMGWGGRGLAKHLGVRLVGLTCTRLET